MAHKTKLDLKTKFLLALGTINTLAILAIAVLAYAVFNLFKLILAGLTVVIGGIQ